MTKVLYTFPGDARPTIAEVGGKGLSLVDGTRAALPIPPGFILTVGFFEPWLSELKKTNEWQRFLTAQPSDLEAACTALKFAAAAYHFTDDQKKVITDALSGLSTSLFAVRSSSPHEDLEGASFAGGYETMLGVMPDALNDAIKQCFLSAFDHRVFVYMRANGFDATDPKIAVIVQQQIASEISGVGFSINPLTNNYDEALFNANWGLGESVVAGQVTPDTYVVDKIREKVTATSIGSKSLSVWLSEKGGTEEKQDFKKFDTTLSDAQLIELTRLTTKVEQQYGKPMDIEWAYARGTLYLLQARPVTTYVPLPPDMLTQSGQKKRLYFDITVTAQGMNKPLSRMGSSVFHRLLIRIERTIWMRDLTDDIDTSIPWVSEGKIYVNLSNLLALFGKKKIVESLPIMDTLAAKAVEQLDESEYVSTTRKILLLPFGLLLRLPRIVFLIYRAQYYPDSAHEWVQKQLQGFEADAARIVEKEAPLQEIFDKLIYEMFYGVFRWTVPLTICARLALSRMKVAAAKNAEIGKEIGKLEMALPYNVTTEMGLALAHVASLLPDGLSAPELRERFASHALPKEWQEAWTQFLEAYGHRGASEIDPAAPRYVDDPAPLLDLMLVTKNAPGEDPRAKFDRNHSERDAAYVSIHDALYIADPRVAEKFAEDYGFFSKFGGYRETHKHYLVLVMAMLRKKILTKAQALVSSGRLDSLEQVFDLTIEQLDACESDASMDLRKLAQSNTVFLNKLRKVPHPPSLIDSRGFIPRPPAPPVREGEYLGSGVSTGVIQGRVKVLHTPNEKPLLKGEILVARATDPGWTPLFVNAAGIILEIGGSLQHGALVAREYGLPCVVGVENATSLWKDGTLVEVDGSSGVIRLIQE